MPKKPINNFFNSRAFYIVISILAAIILWLYVGYTQNPDTTTTISDIPVVFDGEDQILADRSLMITEGADQTVTLKLSGKRTTLAKLTNQNIIITVDLTNVRSTGSYHRTYTITYPDIVSPSSVTLLAQTPIYMTVSIDNLISKEIEVRGVFEGNVAEGFISRQLEFDPEIITVSGPQDIISKISYAWAVLLRENVSETITAPVTFIYMDETGEEVFDEAINSNEPNVLATLPVLLQKTVPLSVDFIDGGGATAKNNVVYSIEPSAITIAGDAETVDSINKISIGTVDLSTVGASLEQPFTIAMPNDVQNISGETEAVLKLDIKGLETKKLTTSNFEFINTPTGCTAEAVTQSLEVTVRASAQVIDKIKASNLRVVADLSEFGHTTGVFTAEVKIYVDGYENAGAVGAYSLTVNLSGD